MNLSPFALAPGPFCKPRSLSKEANVIAAHNTAIQSAIDSLTVLAAGIVTATTDLNSVFDAVGLGLGVAPAFKGAFNWLRHGDDVARGSCGILRRLTGSGCFRGSTITYRLIDGAQDSESLVVEVQPLLVPEDDQSRAMLACVLIGVGGFSWQRERKRRQAAQVERRAIDSVFGESPQDDELWN